MIDGIATRLQDTQENRIIKLLDIQTLNQFKLTLRLYNNDYQLKLSNMDNHSLQYLTGEEAVSFWEQLATRVTSNETKKRMLAFLEET